MNIYLIIILLFSLLILFLAGVIALLYVGKKKNPSKILHEVSQIVQYDPVAEKQKEMLPSQQATAEVQTVSEKIDSLSGTVDGLNAKIDETSAKVDNVASTVPPTTSNQ